MKLFRLLVAALITVSAGQVQATPINGSITESDFLAEDNNCCYYVDAFSVMTDSPTEITIIYDAGDTLIPWFYILDSEVVTSTSTIPVQFPSESNFDDCESWGSAVGCIEYSYLFGDIISTTFYASVGTTYQIVVTSLLYDFQAGDYGGIGYLGDYSLGIYALEVDANLTISQVEIAVPEPSTLALLAIGLFGMGLARRRKV